MFDSTQGPDQQNQRVQEIEDKWTMRQVSHDSADVLELIHILRQTQSSAAEFRQESEMWRQLCQLYLDRALTNDQR